ncbi:unnamed protein product [Moneuplotes crassus]|uniref:PI-PLC Y-box domain-containing protein n=1 Tax=Euplotes crassus TaxID=5936 RepID=A0AAD1XAS4_EUPCR|nr:unnamed protein product [Moneuplotes crassus]
MQCDKTQALDSEKSILKKSKSIIQKFAMNHYFNCFGNDWDKEVIFYDPRENNLSLNLSLEAQKDIKYIQKISFSQFSNGNMIHIKNIRMQTKYLAYFLSFSFPQKVNELTLVSDQGFTLKITPYFNEIMRLNSKVLEKIYLNGFRFNTSQFKRLMVSYAHVHKIGLRFCDLSFPVAFFFGELLADTQIHLIDLAYSVISKNSDCDNYLDEFTIFIKALASSPDLKLSLNEIFITSCGIENCDAETILNDNGLEHVKIWV